MAFTNIWDVTFPPDSQLANLLGQDLRNFRLDVQQRMGAISGLDANKPAFSGDTQPANWNGVLFFATDTGKVYQWNNPSWTDVTTSVAGRLPVFLANGGSFATAHMVTGDAFVASSPGTVTVNLSGGAVFSGGGNYFVVLGGNTAGAVTYVNIVSGSQFNISASLSCFVNYICIGN